MRGLYAIVDPAVCLDRDPIEVARQILRGGCAALQLRDKSSSDGAFMQLGSAIVELCRQAGVPFIVNDRHWLAAELRAQGVHLGQTDAPIEQVRRQLPATCTIGLSTHTLEQALDAERRGAQLIGFGPVFATHSKLAADPVVGIAGLAAVCQRVAIPVVAIGGVTLARAAEIASARAPLAAAISALCAAHDPEQAARALHAALG
jgi:thiamine-phosphate pyrophosphorylase